MEESILIIDDHEEILDFISEILGKQYNILTAANGEAAVNILEKDLVDLIVSDVMMPIIDGFELCRILKSSDIYCHIPLILLTAKNSFLSKIEGLEIGADAYIEKPFSPKLLQTQIANLLSNRVKIKNYVSNAPFQDTRLKLKSRSDEQFLKKLSNYININMADSNLNVDHLAYFMNMSRSTFYRKVKQLSNISPKELIDEMRLKKAIELISENDYKVFQIARMVGYNSQSVFGKIFYRNFKQTPVEYINTLKQQSLNNQHYNEERVR